MISIARLQSASEIRGNCGFASLSPDASKRGRSRARSFSAQSLDQAGDDSQGDALLAFAGGKRLRPILCLAAAEACGGKSALPLACAIECIHTYSLIHDDLPSMDNDDFRRGRPTCHKVFGDGIAVLAGDALLTIAFEIAAEAEAWPRYDLREIFREISIAAGSRKLIAGQVADLEGEGKKSTRAQLRYIHENKTAAMLTTSVRLGAMSANATPTQLNAMSDFGRALGLAFQVIDDIPRCHPDKREARQKRGEGCRRAERRPIRPSWFGKIEGRSRTPDAPGARCVAAVRQTRRDIARARELSPGARVLFGRRMQRVSPEFCLTRATLPIVRFAAPSRRRNPRRPAPHRTRAPPPRTTRARDWDRSRSLGALIRRAPAGAARRRQSWRHYRCRDVARRSAAPNPACLQPNDICARNSPLQLTPPLTVTSGRRAARAAAIVFATNTSTTARWNDAQRSRWSSRAIFGNK